MAGNDDFDDDRDLAGCEPGADCATGPAGPSREVLDTLETMRRLCAGELDFVVEAGRLAGLETSVVLAVTPGGLVPLFAHVTGDIFPVLVPAADAAGRPVSRAAARAALN